MPNPSPLTTQQVQEFVTLLAVAMKTHGAGSFAGAVSAGSAAADRSRNSVNRERPEISRSDTARTKIIKKLQQKQVDALEKINKTLEDNLELIEMEVSASRRAEQQQEARVKADTAIAELKKEELKNLKQFAEESQADQAELQSLNGKSLVQMQAIMATRNSLLTDSQKTLSNANRQSKLMTAAIIANPPDLNAWNDPVVFQQYRNSLKTSLVTGINGVSSSWLKQQNLIDDITGELREDISPGEMQDVYLKMKGSLDVLESEIDKFSSIGNLDEMLNMDSASWSVKAAALTNDKASDLGIDKNATDAGDKLQAKAISDTIESMVKSGLLTDELMVKFGIVIDETTGKLTSESKQSIIASAVNRKGLATHTTALQQSAKNIEDQAKKFSNANAIFIQGLSKQNLTKKFKEKISELVSVTAGLTMMASGAKQAYGEAKEFNIAGVAKTFGDVSVKATTMGMNFEEASKFYSEQKQIAASLGNEQFDKFVKSSQLTMRELGYTDKQSSEFVVASAETAKQAGIDMSDAEKMNSFVKDSAKAFQGLLGITNLTAGEFQKMRTEIASNVDVQSVSIGMTAEQTALRMKENDATFRSLMLAGLTDEQAKRQILANANEARMKVSDRIKKGAMLKVGMDRLGFSAEESNFAMRATNLGRNASQEDQARLKELMSEATQRGAEKRLQQGQNVGGLFAEETIQEFINPIAGLDTQEQVDQIIAKKANAGARDPDKTNQQAKGSPTVAKAAQTIEMGLAAVSSSLGLVALGLAGVTAGLLLNTKIGGGGIGERLFDFFKKKGGSGTTPFPTLEGSTPGKASRWSRFVQGTKDTGTFVKGGAAAAGGHFAGVNTPKWAAGASGATKGFAVAGTAAAKGLGGLALGFIGGIAVDALKEKGHEKTAAVADIATSTASGAMAGAMFGPLGAGIGALVGGVYGLIKNWDQFSKIASDTWDWYTGVWSSIGDGISSMAGKVWDMWKYFAGFSTTATAVLDWAGNFLGIDKKNREEKDKATAAEAMREKLLIGSSAIPGLGTLQAAHPLANPLGSIPSNPLSFGETVAKPNTIASFDSTGTGSQPSTSSDSINNNNSKTKSILEEGGKLSYLPTDEQITYLKTIAENAIASVRILEQLLAKEGTAPTLLGRGTSFTDSVQSYFTGRRAAGDA